MQYPEFTSKHKSLMAKYLNKEIFDKLKDLKTANNFSIEDAIYSGLKNPDSGIGIYAGDSESYILFSPLFDKIIYNSNDSFSTFFYISTQH